MKEKFMNNEYWFSLFGVIAYYCMGISNVLNENNTTYALEQIHQYDSSLFANNFAVYNTGMSARFFLNFIVGFGMKLTHGSWTTVVVPLIYLGVFILAVATVEIVFNITEKNRLFLVFVLAFFLKNSINTGFPGWGSFELDSIGMGTAYTFTMLALSQVIGKNKKWNLAWIFLSVAALCHVHEGIWGFCLLFVIYVCQVVKEKTLGLGKRHWAFVVFVVVLGICVIPGLYGEPSGLTSEEFVKIYAYYRTPHHLVPSAWGINSILKYLFIILGTALVRIITLSFTNKEGCKEFYLETGLAVGSWIVAICTVYLFTEIFPVVPIVTMFIPKYLKYIGILSQIWCIECIDDWIEKDEIMIAGLSAVTVWCASLQDLIGVFVFYGVFLVALVLWKKYEVKEMKYMMPIGVLGIVTGMASGNLANAIVLIFFLYCIIPWKRWAIMKKTVPNSFVVIALSVLMLLIATKDKVWTICNGDLVRVTSKSYLENAMGGDLYNLAIVFENTTDTDETFISDPYSSMTSWFQLGSRRNSYTNNKNVPAAQSQIKEWYERIEETRDILARECDEIHDIMERADVDYILVNIENYEKFDMSETFQIRNVSANDQFRIYEIK